MGEKKIKGVELLKTLKKDIDNRDSDLWKFDYGCDGMDDSCCGCGGDELSEAELEYRIDEIIKLLTKSK